jgi:mannosylglycoprotein endo-beta-mannosidase
MKKYFLLLILIVTRYTSFSQLNPSLCVPSSAQSVLLRSVSVPGGTYKWQMKKVSEADNGKELSSPSFHPTNWLPAIIPGTVLNSLVANKVYPEPYYGDNNRLSRKLIPDIANAGKEFYHYWFRTVFNVPKSFTGRRIWLKFHGINYRCDIWVNGKNLGKMAGMFNTESYDITDIISRNGQNVLAVNALPVDFSGTSVKKNAERTGAVGENHNGGDGEIGKNVTMLMSVGWDFTAPDGIRDRNTGIWRDVEIYSTGDVVLNNPFVQTKLPLPDTLSSKQTVSVELKNASNKIQKGVLSGNIIENGSAFSQYVTLAPHETKTVIFTPEIYKKLVIQNPKLWWPINKGKQNLYTLSLKYNTAANIVSHTITTHFGIREISSDQNTPDKSRRFLVNGQPIFIRGTNWVPEAMLRNSEQRTYAELRYTKQAGVNLLRLWGGGVAESDYFYRLCDEFGFLVWTEFWITGDTRFPADTTLYLKNLSSTVKRIRNHASVAYYVASNESSEVPGTAALIKSLDPATGYQIQSECCGVHDGSPYKYENPMQYFENTASRRGSRVDGFNPEYGTPSTPILESLKKLMPAKDLWPINDSVWNYLDGNGFHQITTKYREAVDAFGKSSSITEFAKKAQFVGAMNFRAIWEVWNYNKFNYGDRFASGFLFWYHNSPLPQTASRMYDWFLEPTAALYYSQNGLAPLHPQFDYLKNTVSIYNDYRKAFANYSVEATVYDFDSKKVWAKTVQVNIPADGVVNDAIKIDFPENLTQVHFIKLILKDNSGKVIADSFYWRSKDKYTGAWTMTGPAVSGFEDINKLPEATLKTVWKKKYVNGKLAIEVNVNNSSKALSFFNQLKLQDGKGNNIAPTYYSDNFFSLLPGETKTVTIETEQSNTTSTMKLITEGWNTKPVQDSL